MPSTGAAFTGGSPGREFLVGEIRGLRTFRVDDGGWLLPLYSDGCWYDGPNTAVCSPPTGDRRSPHPVPDEDCECGFYAYASPQAAAASRATHYVRAVVSCWGDVLAGTQGLRAQHARIDAIWLHPHAPRWVRQRVASRYPSARLFDDADVMIEQYPLTELRCYRPDERRTWLPRAATALLAAAVLALGVIPEHLLRAHPPLWFAWLAATGLCAAVGLWFLGARSIGHLSGAAIMFVVLAWLLAPLLGPFGWLLRLPLLRALLVGAAGHLLALTPNYFPLVRAVAARRFDGARA